MNFVSSIKKAYNWIENNSTNCSVNISVMQKTPYQEVSGYFVPTLKALGFKNKAISFCDWLISEQLPEGAWGFHKVPHVFDTAQVIDGLAEFGEKYRTNMDLAYKWIKGRYCNEGFDDPNLGNDAIPESINLRILWPLKKAGYDITYFSEILEKNNGKFDSLSHFYAYGFEGAVRLGLDYNNFLDIVKKYEGKIPAKSTLKDEYCYTGLSQTALSLFLADEFELGMKVLEFVSQFQNRSGGFYGGSLGSGYFVDDEPSWAVKFYMDAFLEAAHSWFRKNVNMFSDGFFEGGQTDKRLNYIQSKIKENERVLDAGCGGGRYINNIVCNRYACDLERAKNVNADFSKGSCSDLPHQDAFFDKVICCECLEHLVFKDQAIQEMLRVIKPGGSLLIIDKNKINQTPFTHCLHFGEEWVDFDQINKQFGGTVTELKQEGLMTPFFGAEIRK